MSNSSNSFNSSFGKYLDQYRGEIDFNSLKNYLITLVFLKYLTEESKVNKDFEFVVPNHSDFDAVLNWENKGDLCDGINKCLSQLADINPPLRRVIDYVDFNQGNGRNSNRKLTEVIGRLIVLINTSNEYPEFQNSNNVKFWPDLFDYIMLYFSEYSGKSFVDISTPKEVNEIISKLLNIDEESKNISVYDPTCGIGNSLIEVAKFSENKIELFGQEINSDLVFEAKLNLLIHGVSNFEIENGDVLNYPKFLNQNNQIRKFDYVISNPPFSLKSWNHSQGIDSFNRWNSKTGIPPNSNADFAFLLHILESLKPGGRAVTIVPHGVLFRSGSETNIRKYLVKNGFLKGIIGLPSRLYFGTGIPSCILVLEKIDSITQKGVFIMDASSEFVKDKFTNKITTEGIYKIIDTWSSKKEVSEFSKFVSFEEIQENDYNLNIPRYLINVEDVIVPADSELVELSSILRSIPKIRTNNDFATLLKISDLSDDPFLYKISIDKLSVGEVNRIFYKLTKPALLISKRFNKLKPSFCEASEVNPIFVSPDIEAFTLINPSIDLSYLILQLKSDFVLKQAESLSIGATMPSLSKADILKLKIIIPDLKTQDSIVLQKGLAEGAKVQSDKNKIETFQLQTTIDSLLKERMNDFQWKLHDIRNGELLNLKGQVVILEMFADANPNLFNNVIDEENNTTALSSIKDIYASVQKLAVILSDLYNTSDNIGEKEDIEILNFIKDFCEDQLKSNGNLFKIDYTDIDKIKIDFDIVDLVVYVNKKDLQRVFTNIFVNAIKHGGFENSNQVNKFKIELSLDPKKEIVTIAVLNNGKPSKINAVDYFADGGKAGTSSNSGKGGHIIKVLTERNNGKVFQNNYTLEEASGYTFEVGIQFNYKLFYEL